ncbi:MAG: hypothetical protein AVDCRST_MAG65-510, partial [uncultured Solirubrobacteraceae bacterium]
EAALARTAGDRRPLLHRSRRPVRDRPPRQGQPRPLVLDRAPDQDPCARGAAEHRRQDRPGPGVHAVGLPAHLHRARVHHRRPQHVHRLRPRHRRSRPPDPCAGHLQARRDRRPQRLGRLRRLVPARGHGRRQQRRGRRRRGVRRRARQRGGRRRPGEGHPDATASGDPSLGV